MRIVTALALGALLLALFALEAYAIGSSGA